MKIKVLWLVAFSPILFSCSSNESAKTENQNPIVSDTVSNQSQNTGVSEGGEMKQPSGPSASANYEVRTFANTDESSGFGYDILANGKAYIHQPHIPAIPGNRGFATEAAAKKAAEFILTKIKKNIMPPSVTKEELDSLGVI